MPFWRAIQDILLCSTHPTPHITADDITKIGEIKYIKNNNDDLEVKSSENWGIYIINKFEECVFLQRSNIEILKDINMLENPDDIDDKAVQEFMTEIWRLTLQGDVVNIKVKIRDKSYIIKTYCLKAKGEGIVGGVMFVCPDIVQDSES
jgi:hypothetical protein